MPGFSLRLSSLLLNESQGVSKSEERDFLRCTKMYFVHFLSYHYYVRQLIRT